MEQKDTQEANVPQPHPTLVNIRNFLNDCLTENEYYARCSAVLQMIHPNVIFEAAKQLQEHQAAQAAHEANQPTE